MWPLFFFFNSYRAKFAFNSIWLSHTELRHLTKKRSGKKLHWQWGLDPTECLPPAVCPYALLISRSGCWKKLLFSVFRFLFFKTKLTPFPLEAHWFLPVCCFCVKPNQHVGPISLSVNASRLLGTAFLRSTPFSKPAGRQQKDLWDFIVFRIHTARKNHGLFIHFLVTHQIFFKLRSDWSCWKIKKHSQFKPTHIVPLNSPICFKGLFPPLTSAEPMYKHKTIGNNWVTLSAWGYSWPSWCSWTRQELCLANLVGVAEIWYSVVTNYIR